MAEKRYTQFKIKIPMGLPPIVRERIGDKVIEYIRDRTSKGRNKDEGSFPKYSDSYIASDDFNIAGKSKSKVNLKLSGDMMDTLSLLEHGDGTLLIGYRTSDEVAGRVEGNVRGTYGKKTGNASKARNFLGITKSKLDLIVSEVTASINQQSITETTKENDKVINNLLNNFLGSIVTKPKGE